MLDDPPDSVDEIARVTLIALSVEISEIQDNLLAESDAGNRPRDLASDEVLAADRTFVVEQNSI